jgi:hypothetical protein
VFLSYCIHFTNKNVGVTLTFNRIQELWYGVSQDDIEWVLKNCAVCQLRACNKTKPVTKPITTCRCMDRVQLDLMDFRSLADGRYKWILQVKDTFSQHIWLYALEDKGSEEVYNAIVDWIGQNGNPWAFACDNGSEFKGLYTLLLLNYNLLIETGKFKDLCNQLGINIINGRSYHPQTQGSVERANQTFKRRLGSLQRERHIPGSKWVHLLLELALIINTTSSSVLPGKASPFYVWFGRKPHFFEPDYRQVPPIDLEDNEDVFNGDNEDLVLTEIETKVAEFNARLQARMIKQSQGNQVVQFVDGSIATLWIPKKLRLRTEMERIAVRILASDHGAYKLMSQHGRIGGRFPADELNSVSNHVNLGDNIPMEPEFKAGKEVIVPFSVVVARENNRGSITSAQAAGRAFGRASGRASGSGSGSRPVVANDGALLGALATATNVVSNVANALANSPTPARCRRQPPVRVPPALEPEPEPEPAPAPAKRTRKRKALDGVGEVDIGPRKLRSRK